MAHSAQRRKELGAFYTPPEMAQRLVDWCLRTPADRVLDPSFGGFVFLEGAKKRLITLGADPDTVGTQICGVDLDEVAHQVAATEENLADCRLIKSDFFRLKPSQELKFTANVGNPPYIRYQAWNRSAKKAHSVAADIGVPLTRLSSTWAPFILHGCQFLERSGRMGQVLPAELLYSQYARPVVDYLLASFESVTIALFETKVFPGALEEVILLFADGYGCGPAPGMGVVASRDLSELTLDRIDGMGCGYLDPTLPLLRLLPKRTQRLYSRLAASPGVKTLGDFASVDIGVVTGANNFFLRSQAEISERGFDRSLFRVGVAKATDLSGTRLTTADLKELDSKGRRTALFDAAHATEDALRTVEELVREGESQKFHERYKCRIRSPWFALPIPRRGAPDAFLTYMNNAFPRLVLNEVNALSTNTIHNVSLLNGESPAALSVAFYNSLTLLSAELVGRSYGGGILKLEPTEAERLLIPPFDDALLEVLGDVDAAVRARDLERVLDLVDPLVLYPLGITAAEVAGLRRARERSSAFGGGRGTPKPMTQPQKTIQQGTGARAPLAAALKNADGLKTGSFAQVEAIFLAALRQFDQFVADGKGDFLNDFLGVLLKNGSGKEVTARGGVPGLSFPTHFLDCSYPATGDVLFIVETKATGIPKHPRNPRQRNPEGRAGSADLEKRVKEAALKNIDIKAESARRGGKGGGATSDLQTFLRQTSPLTCMFISSRVVSDNDRDRVEHYARIAGVWFDYCGIYCYGLDKSRAKCEAKAVHPTLELDRVLSQVTTALRNLP